jgi:hypothetical protein
MHGKKLDPRIVAIVAVAGLLTGAVLTSRLMRPSPASEPQDTARVSPAQDLLEDGPPPGEADERAEGTATDEPGEVSDTAPAPQEESSSDSEEELDERDRWAVIGARKRAEQQGVEEYVELDERLWMRISVELVIAASYLRHHKNAKELLVDRTAQVLAEQRVDPDAFAAYTKQVAENPQRAAEMGERILKEAEKRTQMEIEVDTIPGLPPAELDIPPREAD